MPTSRAYEIRLPGNWPPEAVDITGPSKSGLEAKAQRWRYEGNTLTTVIMVPRTEVAGGVKVRVYGAREHASRRDLDGFAGAMARLREAYDELNQTFPIA